MIRIFTILVALVASLNVNAQVHQAQGKGVITYQGPTASVLDKDKALEKARLKAIETYYAEAGESESENFDNVRAKILEDTDRYVLETTVLGEEDRADKKQYTVAVRVSLNVANLRNLRRSNSAAGQAVRGEKSPLAFVFVSREVASLKTFDDRVYKRVDEKLKAQGNDTSRRSGSEGESIRGNAISTTESVTERRNVNMERSQSIESGGSTTKRAEEATYRLFPSANLNTVFSGIFARAGYQVVEAAMVEPQTKGRFSVSKVEQDYKSGTDLKSATVQSIASGMRIAGIPYVALGTLDLSPAYRDEATGLPRVSVTINAKLYNLTSNFPSTDAAVGPESVSATGPDEGTARGNALKLAAEKVARELASQATALRKQ